MVELIPVIEFEPGAYHLGERSSPTSQDPTEWERYWMDSLADAGIHGIEPFEPGSWFVSIDMLQSQEILRVLLNINCQGFNIDDLEGFSALPGGYFLTVDTKTLPPQCCCDLSNLNDWRKATSHRAVEWQMLWIGHPWTHVSAENDRLTLLEPTEEDPPSTLKTFASFDRSELLSAVSRAEQLKDAFRNRLREIVAESFSESPLNHEEIIEILLNGH
ncbi:MAG: hypothetical protein AB8C95_10245 [Phycisphaeraceae bacterium]